MPTARNASCKPEHRWPFLCRARELEARRQALQEILAEVSRAVTRNGARGVARSFQALEAALSVGTEYLTNYQRGVQEQPQVAPLFDMLHLCSVLWHTRYADCCVAAMCMQKF